MSMSKHIFAIFSPFTTIFKKFERGTPLPPGIGLIKFNRLCSKKVDNKVEAILPSYLFGKYNNMIEESKV